MKSAPMTYSLIALCALVFLVDYFFTSFSSSDYSLFYWESPRAHFVQYVSHLFLHGGVWHLLLNMFGLWMFGANVERLLGAKKFLLFYFLCGIGAAGVYQLVTYYQFQYAITPLLDVGIARDTVLDVFNAQQFYQQFPTSKQAIMLYSTPVVGASGAIYGVLVAFAYLFPNYKIIFLLLPIPIAAKIFVPILLLIDIFSGFTGFSIFGQNIAYAAHVGGAIVGFLLMLMLRRPIANGRHASVEEIKEDRDD